MPRYIDAEKIPYTSYLGDDEPRVYKSEIESIPSAPVEPVVHCGECKLYDSCLVEDNFKFGRLAESHRYCGAGKRKGGDYDA